MWTSELHGYCVIVETVHVELGLGMDNRNGNDRNKDCQQRHDDEWQPRLQETTNPAKKGGDSVLLDDSNVPAFLVTNDNKTLFLM